MKLCGCSLPTFVAVTTAVVAYVLFNLGVHKKVDTSLASFQRRRESCRSLSTTSVKAPSCEDFRFISENIIITGHGEITSFLDHGDSSHATTHMVVIDLVSEKLRELDLTNFPTGIKFRPHGLDVREGRLYVVNHADKAEERVEIFELSNPDSIERVAIKWIKAIHPPIPPRSLNSVAAASEDQIYVTHWLPYGVPAGGLEGAKGFSDKMLVLANYLNIIGLKILGLPAFTHGDTSVYRCDVNTGKCVKAAGNFISANGIVVSPDGKLVFVCDVLHGSLNVFSRDTNGNLTLKLSKKLPYEPDNVMLNPASPKNGKYELWTGTIGSFVHYLFKWHPLAGSLVVASYDPALNSMAVEDSFVHDGSVLSGTATAAKWGNKVLLSGPKKGGGIVICDVEKDRA